MTSITLFRASAPRSACLDRSPRSPASSPSSTTSRTSRPPRPPPGRDDFREQRPACRGRPPPRPRGRERRSAPRLQGCGPCPPARGVRAGPASRRGHSRTVQGLLGPVAGVLHIRKGRPRRRIPCFPHDSATLPRTSVFSRRSPMCRADPSAHGRISTVLNAGTFPHDSADPPPAGLGRMCSASPTGPMPHIRPARHREHDPDTALALPRRRADPRPCTAIPGKKGSVSLQGARCSPTCHLMESAPGRCVRASRSGLHRVAKVRRRIRPGTASCMTRSSESGARSSIIPFTPHPTASSGLMSPRTHWSAQRAKSSSLKGRAS